MTKMIRRIATIALLGTQLGLVSAALSPAALAAEPARASLAETSGRHLLILAKDGAFVGNLGSPAGRPVALAASHDGGSHDGVGAVLTALTDAHGWRGEDRTLWRQAALADAARSVCTGEVAALAVIADPADPALADALAGCGFRIVDLGDGVSRAHAAASGLKTGWFAADVDAGVTLGATTLRIDAAVQVAATAE